MALGIWRLLALSTLLAMPILVAVSNLPLVGSTEPSALAVVLFAQKNSSLEWLYLRYGLAHQLGLVGILEGT